MQNVADKCFFGLALSQTIEDLKLNKQKDIIMDIYRKRSKDFSTVAVVKSSFLGQKQYPVQSYSREDKNKEKQYYTAVLHKPGFTGPKVPQCLKNKQFALVQGFSTNDDPKKRTGSKSKKQKDRSPAPKKMVKKN